MEIIIWFATKNLGPAQYINQFFVCHKKIGQAQNILGPVEGRGIRLQSL